PYITNGAGERTAGTGGNVAMTFSWTGNRFWGIAGIELKAAHRLYVDAEGGYPTPGWLNAANFSSIQAAIDALPSAGGVVYIPSGTYTITSTITIPVNKRVHLLGVGIDRTIITMTSSSIDILK